VRKSDRDAATKNLARVFVKFICLFNRSSRMKKAVFLLLD